MDALHHMLYGEATKSAQLVYLVMLVPTFACNCTMVRCKSHSAAQPQFLQALLCSAINLYIGHVLA